MGTSASSKGPGAGVSLDPAWLDDIDIPNQNSSPDDRPEDNKPIIAPAARFGKARRGMGEYVRTGSKEALRKSLRHYSKVGMGGSHNLAQRMRTSSKVATGFVRALSSLREENDFELGRIISDLKKNGANANQIIDTIVEHVCPHGGSIDEISTRDSGRAALSEFMDCNPDADIAKLTDDQIWTLTGLFLGNEVFTRVQFDIGQAFEKQNVSYVERVNRLNEMREYIQSEISTQLNAQRNIENQTMDMEKLFEKTIQNTFEVYEVEV